MTLRSGAKAGASRRRTVAAGSAAAGGTTGKIGSGRRPACGAGERVPGTEEDERHEDEAEQRGRPRESERADTERQRHQASVASQTSHSTPRSAAATA